MITSLALRDDESSTLRFALIHGVDEIVEILGGEAAEEVVLQRKATRGAGCEGGGREGRIS